MRNAGEPYIILYLTFMISVVSHDEYHDGGMQMALQADLLESIPQTRYLSAESYISYRAIMRIFLSLIHISEPTRH